MEIVSPANKDRRAHVEEFIDKAEIALLHGIHLLLIDLFPPGPHDPHGMHAALWERFDDEPYRLPPGEPLTLASYVAEPCPDAYVEHLAVGSPLAEMPLFLNPDHYVNTPLEPTYRRPFAVCRRSCARPSKAAARPSLDPAAPPPKLPPPKPFPRVCPPFSP